jgi:hypothetical protein
VTKVPRFAFEKFKQADDRLTTQMKSVGEVMAIGRTFKEALLKGIRALDTGKKVGSERIEPKILTQRLVTPHPERLTYVRYAIRQGYTVKQLAKVTSIDPWFLRQLREMVDLEAALAFFVGSAMHHRPAHRAHVVFGGPNFDTLYAMCSDKVYKRKTKVKGVLSAQPPIKPPAPRL